MSASFLVNVFSVEPSLVCALQPDNMINDSSEKESNFVVSFMFSRVSHDILEENRILNKIYQPDQYVPKIDKKT